MQKRDPQKWALFLNLNFLMTKQLNTTNKIQYYDNVYKVRSKLIELFFLSK